MFRKLTLQEQLRLERGNTAKEKNRRLEAEKELEQANKIIAAMNNANSSILEFQEEVLQDIIFEMYK